MMKCACPCQAPRNNNVSFNLHAAARFVGGLQPQDHVTATMMKLHWLPVRQRITYKLCCLMHGVVHGHAPEYVVDMVDRASLTSTRPITSAISSTRPLRHSTLTDCLWIQIVLYCCSTGLEWITSWNPRHHYCYIQETPQDTMLPMALHSCDTPILYFTSHFIIRPIYFVKRSRPLL